MKSIIRRFTRLTTADNGDGFVTASEDTLFPKVDPNVDGEDCDRDCGSCTVHYPPKFDVQMSDKLYGHVKGWATHILIATGKSDWVRDVADEKGSVMEAIEKGSLEPSNGKLKLSASNIPLPDEHHITDNPKDQPTTVLILPAFTIVDKVTPSLAPDLIKYFVSTAPTTTTPLYSNPSAQLQVAPPVPDDTPLRSRPCPHAAVILLCSQRTRDARCGQSAPLLRREFERHLRMRGLYRDLHDERPGGVGVYFISHVGGHKYSANVLIYRRRDFEWFRKQAPKKETADEAAPPTTTTTTTTTSAGGADDDKDDGKAEAVEEDNDGRATTDGWSEGAVQGIWLARVRPEECEGIVKFTVLQGKVVKPDLQLRGGFDRERGLISW